MSSSIVSVRVPSSLAKSLRDLAVKNHFMDLSEEIRFLIKQKMIQQIDPFAYEVQKLKDELKKEISKKSRMDRTRFVEELKNLLDEMKEEKGAQSSEAASARAEPLEVKKDEK